MSLLYIDSFDGYTTAEIGRYWYNNAAGIGGQISTLSGDARTGTACARPGAEGWARGFAAPSVAPPYEIGVLRNEVVIGAAVKFSPIPASNFIFRFFLATAAALGSAPDGNLLSIFNQATLNVTESGLLSVDYGNFNAHLAVSDPHFPVHFGSYNYIEWKVQFGNTGYSEVRLDGRTVQSGNVMITAVPTTIGGTLTTNHDQAEGYMISGAGGGGAPVAYDDFYILEVANSPNNDFLNDSRVNIFMPSINGTTNNFTPTGSSTNWQNVNEIPTDDDSTYNTGTASGQIDEYGHDTLTPSNFVIPGVQVWQRVRDPDGASSIFVPLLDDNGSTFIDLTGTYTAGIAYADFPKMFDLNGTTSAWTSADFNQTTFGLKDLG